MRIIPAFAGNTCYFWELWFFQRDHPRIRGEHYNGVVYRNLIPGSSPHSRGTLSAVTKNHVQTGIIPAFAGNTVSCDEKSCSNWDHPRIRGEHTVCVLTEKDARGSSPHSRGTLLRLSGRRAGLGIIPAFAGNTNRVGISFLLGKDHPRIRGEHRFFISGNLRRSGSSPHSRGTH